MKMTPHIITNPLLLRLFNMGLRMGALALKLLLTLYIARYFTLSDMGTYGLVASTVAISIPLLGFRLDYMVTRELVDAPPLKAASLIRDEVAFYGLNYLLLGLVVLTGLLLVPHEQNNIILVITYFLCALESLCTITSTNFIYFKRPILANMLFFLRSAAWTIPVIVLGLFMPDLRSLSFVFSLWLVGLVCSLLVTVYMLKDMPWVDVFATRIDWVRLRRDAKACIPIWLGAIGATGAINIDRFIVEYSMNREMVGVLSFFSSFATALTALVASGVIAFKQPHLIAHHKDKNHAEFWKVTKEITAESTIAAVLLAIVMALVIPAMATMMGKPEITAYKPVLWLVLLGVVIRLAGESLNNVLYARHQDKALWVGSLLYLVVAVGLNIWLVPLYGLYGAGYTAVLASLFIIVWRLYHVRVYVPANEQPAQENQRENNV